MGRRKEILQEGAPDWWIISIEGGPAVKTGALDVLRRQGHSVSPRTLDPTVSGG